MSIDWRTDGPHGGAPERTSEPPDYSSDEMNLFERIAYISELLDDARTSGLYADEPDTHQPRDRAIRDALYKLDADEYVQGLLRDVEKALREHKRRAKV